MKKLREIVENSDQYPTPSSSLVQPAGYGISPSQFKEDLKSGNTNYGHVHNQAINHLTGSMSHIGPQHRQAVQLWTQNGPNGYRDINNFLRTGNGTQRTQQVAANLKQAVEGHELPNSTWAYRGIHGPHAENLNRLNPGDVFHAKGFSSTTLDPKRATHFAKGEDILAIHIPAGSKALYSSHPMINSWGAEKEMTLPNNSHFRYNGHENITAPEYHYTGEPTGETKNYRLHHVELMPHASQSIQIDRS